MLSRQPFCKAQRNVHGDSYNIRLRRHLKFQSEKAQRQISNSRRNAHSHVYVCIRHKLARQKLQPRLRRIQLRTYPFFQKRGCESLPRQPKIAALCKPNNILFKYWKKNYDKSLTNIVFCSIINSINKILM